MIGDEIAVDGVPVTDDSHPVGLKIDGNTVTIDSQDECWHFYAQRRSHSERPFHFLNIMADIAIENVSSYGVCGSLLGRELVSSGESLFSELELADLYNLCPENPTVDEPGKAAFSRR